MHRKLCLIILSLLLSCSSEKAAEVAKQKPDALPATKPAEYKLEILPKDATRDSTLSIMLNVSNPSDAKIEWFVNGSPVSAPMALQFKPTDTKRGDKIYAKAVIQGRGIISNIIEIKNTPPELTKVKIMPEVFKPGETLYVDAAASDVDGDGVTVLYAWTKNGEAAGKGKQIDAPLKRGDKISIRVTPFDGEIYGGSITLNREIGNLPPMIIDNKDVSFEQDVFTYQVKATDPDGDSLAYSLKTAPSGMSIDAQGLIRWKVPLDFKGKAPVTVSVTDGHRGEATQNFVLEIKAE